MTLRFNYLPSLALATLLTLLAFSASAQPRVDLAAGTISILGSLKGHYEMTGFDKPQHAFKITSDVGLSFFADDNLAIGGSLPVEWVFTPKVAGNNIGLKLFTTYFFDIESVIFPYLGVNVTPAFDYTATAFRLRAGLDAGLLVSLSEAVALDFGLNPEISFKLSDKDQWFISIPAGFVGVRAFF